jgi:uncharacterized membrane protein
MGILERILQNPKTTILAIITAVVSILQVLGIEVPAGFAEAFAGGIVALILYISKPELNSPVTWTAVVGGLGALASWIFGWQISESLITAFACVATTLMGLFGKDNTPKPATT